MRSLSSLPRPAFARRKGLALDIKCLKFDIVTHSVMRLLNDVGPDLVQHEKRCHELELGSLHRLVGAWLPFVDPVLRLFTTSTS